jgi:hypothetical protein
MHNKVTAGERDAKGNITNENDYRVLQPTLVMDPNGNRSAVAFDALGMVTGTAQMGKPGDNVGDSFDGFLTDLNDAAIDAYILNPMADPHGILKKATTRLVYDLSVYYRTRNDHQPSPSIVCTLARVTHDKALGPDQQTRIQHTFEYSDGFGREIQKKVQAEPEKVDGAPDIQRWVGSGSVIYDNKGNPIRQYEPFFSATHKFEFAKTVGVSSTTFYDPVGRIVATLHPDHTYEKVVFDPWRQETWDMNDNILVADPGNDLVVGDFVSRLPAANISPHGTSAVRVARWEKQSRPRRKMPPHMRTPPQSRTLTPWSMSS